MSKPLTRTYSLRKPIRPLIDIDEADDQQRRDPSGRKRVPVVECLFDTSSDEIDDEHIIIEKLSNILWLTFHEICHIRYVLNQTNLVLDKQYSQLHKGRLCFRCRQKINQFFFLPSFLDFTKHESCFVCQQIICKKCSHYNFVPPSLKLLIPIRIQTLIKPSSVAVENKEEKPNKTNKQTQTICFDCLQVFNEHIKTSQYRLKPPSTPFRRTFSLPPASSKNSNEIPHAVRHRRRPLQITNCKIEKTTITTTSLITQI